jgi:hypothetical protein
MGPQPPLKEREIIHTRGSYLSPIISPSCAFHSTIPFLLALSSMSRYICQRCVIIPKITDITVTQTKL